MTSKKELKELEEDNEELNVEWMAKALCMMMDDPRKYGLIIGKLRELEAQSEARGILKGLKRQERLDMIGGVCLKAQIKELKAENAKLKNNLEAMKTSVGKYTETIDKIRKLEAENAKLKKSQRKLAEGLLSGECEWDGKSRYYKLADGNDTHNKNQALESWIKWSEKE